MRRQEECDLTQVDLIEIVRTHKPQNKLSSTFSDELIKKFFISEEGITEMTGLFKEWILFISLIIDLYEDYKNNSKDKVEFSLEGLTPNNIDNGNLMEMYLTTYLVKNKVKLPKKFNISGTIHQFEHFYRILKEMDNEMSQKTEL